MPFTIEEFVALRPYLYHLTARANLPTIRKGGRLESAERLLVRGGHKHLVTQRRPDCVTIVIDGATVIVRDQRPLYRGNIDFEDGWVFNDVIRYLNQHVFFWPGTAEKISDYGARHYGRYTEEGPVVLRFSTRAIIDRNPDSSPLFCRYNSGSPRCVGGKKSSRGANTFLAGEVAPFSPGNVVEVVFKHSVSLPAFDVGTFCAGRWQPDGPSTVAAARR